MTLERARIIRSGASARADDGPPATERYTPSERVPSRGATGRARRIPAEIVDAKAEAARILTDAAARAAEHAAATAARAAAEARAAETARLAAGFIALRAEEAERLERAKDRVVDLARLLAERLLGEELRLAPERIAALAGVALDEARGAESVRIDASPDDVALLREALGSAARAVSVHADAELGRGSLVVYTNLGRVDARLGPQLARLASALREGLE